MRKTVFGGAVLIILAAVLIVPLPLFVVSAGSALPVAERIDLASPEHEASGRLLFTTVRLSQPAIAAAFAAWIDDDRRVLLRQRVVPEGTDNADYFRAQRRLFTESTELAAAAGLRAAGMPVTVSGDGARVAAVSPGGPADGALQVGDVVVAVDGTRVEVASDLIAATARASSGDIASLTIRRGDEQTKVDVEIREVSALGGPGIGVAVSTLDREIVLPFDVEVDAGRIGGPSAGLMVALTVYELADPGDLTRGRVVAGTGTIDAAGRVGAVGGVPQKVDAAVAEGADLFLAPPGEAEAARDAAAGRLQVVEVASLDDAIAALEAAE